MSKVTKLIAYGFEMSSDKESVIERLIQDFVDDHIPSIVHLINDYSLHCEEEGIKFTERDSEILFDECLYSTTRLTKLHYTDFYDSIVRTIKTDLESEAINNTVCNSLQEQFNGIEVLDTTPRTIKISIDTDYVDDPDDVDSAIDSIFSNFEYTARDLIDGIENVPINFLMYTDFVLEDYLDLDALDNYVNLELIHDIKDINE